MNTLVAKGQQNTFSDHLNAQDSSLWFQIENLDYQAREYRYVRDSIIMVHRRMDAEENFAGKRDTLKNLLSRALQYHLQAQNKQQSSNELLGLLYRNHLQELESVKLWYIGDDRIMSAQSLYAEARKLHLEAEAIRKKVERRNPDPAERASRLDHALRKEERGLRKMNRAWQLYHRVAGDEKNILKANFDPNPVIGELKVITDEALAMVRDDHFVHPVQDAQDEVLPKNREIHLPSAETAEDQNLLESQTGLVFRIQIAASGNPISPIRLDSIYPGMKDIDLIRDDGWLRYTIGHCPTYHHADSLRNYIGVEDAFVVAYKDDQRVDAREYMKEPADWPPVKIMEGLPADTGVTFSVQVAASQNPLEKEELRSIYCGNLPVMVSWEKPFYRYLIGSFKNYVNASKLQRKVCVPGAFVVAHRDGKRIVIREALSIADNP